MYRRLWWILAIIIIFGLVAVASAGVVEGQKKFGDAYYFVKHQALFGLLPGLILFFVCLRIPYTVWRRGAWLLLLGAIGLIGLTFTDQFGLTLKGARAWVHLGGYTFQPVEALKLALIIYLAAWFSGRTERVKEWATGLLPFFAVIGFIATLLALQPDIGTLAIVLAIAISVYFVAGIQWRDLAVMVIVGVVVFGSLIAIAPYRLNRIKAFLDPSRDPRGISYQVNQSLIAIGSGGLWGVGYGNSTQKHGFLPETVGDSIFAIVVEELGVVGGLVLIGLFVALSFSLAQAALAAPDKFGRLYLMGLNAWITTQALVNIAAICGLAPLTGIPLPFISYGGTALAMLMAAIGIGLNIVRVASREKTR